MLHVVIKSPTEIIWEGEAEWVSSENSVGPFDVLPGHANFITLIDNKPIVIQDTNTKKERYVFKRAALLVKNDEVSIYTHLEHKR